MKKSLILILILVLAALFICKRKEEYRGMDDCATRCYKNINLGSSPAACLASCYHKKPPCRYPNC